MFPSDPPGNISKPKVFWYFQENQKETFRRNITVEHLKNPESLFTLKQPLVTMNGCVITLSWYCPYLTRPLLTSSQSIVGISSPSCRSINLPSPPLFPTSKSITFLSPTKLQPQSICFGTTIQQKYLQKLRFYLEFLKIFTSFWKYLKIAAILINFSLK